MDYYKSKGYRLDEKTIKKLAELRKEYRSYNLMFANLIKIKTMDKLKTNKTGKIVWQNIKENEECPYCRAGKIIKKTGKVGEFWACSEHPYCGFTQSITK